ncbi:hypothetical protein GGS20DRAFT_295726 [Poronia punctata]|nr:hypothetical protein GGS20DRAFT_295726 [Poronia punctata]
MDNTYQQGGRTERLDNHEENNEPEGIGQRAGRRHMNAFMLYRQHHAARLMEVVRVHGVRMPRMSTIVGQMWQNISPAEYRFWCAEAARERIRVNEENCCQASTGLKNGSGNTKPGCTSDPTTTDTCLWGDRCRGHIHREGRVMLCIQYFVPVCPFDLVIDFALVLSILARLVALSRGTSILDAKIMSSKPDQKS